jgi:hypothetical protein
MTATTVRSVVIRALRELNQIGADEDPDAGEAAAALASLNAMALGWSADNIHTGWATVELSDDFPLEPRHEEGVAYLLAKRIAGARGQALTPEQREYAELGLNRLQADYKAVESLRVDAGLARMPSQRPMSRYGW